MALAAALRLFRLPFQNVWLDETATLTSALQPSMAGVVKTIIITERIPPFYPLLLHFWTGLFGHSPVSIRLPSAICGVLAVPVTFLVARRFLGTKTALIAALLLAVAPFHVWHSQEARNLTLMILLNMFSIHFFLAWMEDSGKTGAHPARAFWLYLAFTFLALYTYYFSIFTLCAQNVLFMRQRRPGQGRPWVAAQGALAVLGLLPLFFLLATQALSGGRHMAGGDPMTGAAVFPPKITAAATRAPEPGRTIRADASRLLPLIAARCNLNPARAAVFLVGEVPYSLGLGLANVNRPPYHLARGLTAWLIVSWSFFFAFIVCAGAGKMPRSRRFPLLVFLVAPLAGAGLVALFDIRPVYARHAVMALPFACIFAASCVDAVKPKAVRAALLACLLAVAAGVLGANFFDPRLAKDDWATAVSLVGADLGPHDLVVFHGEYARSAFSYRAHTDQEMADRWVGRACATVEVRGRDGSLAHFLDRDWSRLTGGRETIWVVSYYGVPRERALLEKRLGADYVPVTRRADLGRNLFLDRYQGKTARNTGEVHHGTN
jgi:4-amino-4-deoxy-L-arabinose transferase-like glycosyltransferase